MRRRTIYRVLGIASLAVFLFSLFGTTVAAWSTQGGTVNSVDIANVRGQIIEEYVQNQKVVPGALIDKKVQVKNTGSIDMVVRVKVEKAWGGSRDSEGNLIIDQELGTENIIIKYNEKDWYYNAEQDYYYYKGVVEPNGTTTMLFDQFEVEKYLTNNEYKEKEADIVVHMECIQAAGDAISFWGISFEDLGVEYIPPVREDIVTKIEFIDPEKGFNFEINNGDLFANFNNLTPGESRSQTVIVTNSWENDAEIFLFADYIDQGETTEETREMIEKLLREYVTIVITENDGTVLYEGPIWGNVDEDSEEITSMKYPKSLGIFKPEETKELNISLVVDSSVGNEYSQLMGLIKWLFNANGEYLEPPTDPVTEPPTELPTDEPTQPVTQPATGISDPTEPTNPVVVVTTNPPGTSTGKTGTTTTYPGTDTVKTGDSGMMLIYIILMVISAAGAVIVLLLGRKEGKGNYKH